jgi:hypothetical protein
MQKVGEFLRTHRFLMERHDERPWGSYEVALSLDGQGWAVLSDYTFGSRIADEAAAIIALTYAIRQNKFDRQTLNMWLGEGRANELRELVRE